jgi:hypothetical protein
MLKIKDWLENKKDKQFEIIKEYKGGNFVKMIIPSSINVVKRLSDERKYTDSSIVFVRGKRYRIREFYHDFKTVRLQWEQKELICEINELDY